MKPVLEALAGRRNFLKAAGAAAAGAPALSRAGLHYHSVPPI